MLDILKFVFTDWKTFWGTVLLLIILSECIIVPICNTIIRCVNGKKYLEILRDKKEESEEKKL